MSKSLYVFAHKISQSSVNVVSENFFPLCSSGDSLPTVEPSSKAVRRNSLYDLKVFFFFSSSCVFVFCNKYKLLLKWQIADHMVASDPDKDILHESDQLMQCVPELSGQPDQKSQTVISELNEEFVPGTTCE